MEYEYEFRLAVRDAPDSILESAVLRDLPKARYGVDYAKPHFRLKHKRLETKKVLKQVAVFHDGLWFRWVESIEVPHSVWNRKTHASWSRVSSHFHDPLTKEHRTEVTLPASAKLYAFRRGRLKGMVFECEWGTFSSRQRFPDDLEAVAGRCLTQFRSVYSLLRSYPPPNYRLTSCSRKSVLPIETLPQELPEGTLAARKLDGTFCMVYSYPDRLSIDIEGNRHKSIQNATLGDGIVFAGEKMRDGSIVLLDVYQVRGVATCPNRRDVLLEFLPSIPLPDGFTVQRYATRLQDLPPARGPIDGVVLHDTKRDEIFKFKPYQTIDAVFWDGNFELSDGKLIKCSVNLENGAIYEITLDGVLLRRRRDRFVGNSAKQLKRIFNIV